jgi:hypothetical protein
MLIQPPPHGPQGSINLDSNAVVGNKVGNALQRGFVFRAGLVVQLPEIMDQQAVGL